MPSILIADHDGAHRLMLKQLFRHDECYSVVEAEDFAACLAAVGQYRPDIILLDAHFDENGFAVCSRLKLLSVETPIVMLIPDTPACIGAALEVGASDVVTRPIHPLLLWERVHNLLLHAPGVNMPVKSNSHYRQRLERSAAGRDDFIASMSHELRSPLTNLKMHLYLAQRQPERIADHLRMMGQMADQMKALLDDLVDGRHYRLADESPPIVDTELGR